MRRVALLVLACLLASCRSHVAVIEPLEPFDKYVLTPCENADFLLGIRGVRPESVNIQVFDAMGEKVSEAVFPAVAVARDRVFVHADGLVDSCWQRGWFRVEVSIPDRKGEEIALVSKVAFAVLPSVRSGKGFWGVAGLWGLTALTSRFSDTDAMLLREAGVRGIRFFVAWRKMRHASDWQVVWRQMDAIYQIASKFSLDVLPVLVAAPTYATGGKSDRSAVPNDRAWQDFVLAVGRRYQGRIRQWEIWNEPNVKEFWEGDIRAYASKLDTAWRILKKIDPNNKIVVGGTSGVDDRWVRALLAMTQNFDVIAVHTYRKENPEESSWTSGHYGGRTLWDDLRSIRALLPAEKEIWITETGLNTRKGIKGLFSPVSETEQAARMVRLAMIAKSSGVSRAYWWLWRDTIGLGTGLIARMWNVLRPKPALAAMAWINRLLSDNAKVNRVAGGNSDIYQYKIEGREETWMVVWSVSQGRSIGVGCTFQEYRDFTGGRHAVDRRNGCKIHLQPGMPVFWRLK